MQVMQHTASSSLGVQLDKMKLRMLAYTAYLPRPSGKDTKFSFSPQDGSAVYVYSMEMMK